MLGLKRKRRTSKMSNKLRVSIVYGGPSKEHEVSVLTGEAMLNALSGNHYEIMSVLIGKEGEWHLDKKTMSQTQALDFLAENTDFILIGLHGTFGEDGKIQALLDEKKIPYSGSGSHASKLAMNKHDASLLFKDADFHVPQEVVVTNNNYKVEEEILNNIELPVIIKPQSQGSSVGITKVTSVEHIYEAIDKALAVDDVALVQEYIMGTEVSCGVIEDELGKLKALPPTELVPLHSDFFDYDAKYSDGATDVITPARLSLDYIKKVKELSISAHRLIGCSGYSRTDILIKNDDLYIIETNTLPGMTSNSIFPQQAREAGLTFVQVLDLIIQSGLRKGVI